MAILLLDRRAGLAEFTTDTVCRADVLDMIERVTFEVDRVAEAAGSDTMTSLIEIHLTDGRVIDGRAAFGKGSPQNPMTDAELMTKFLECAEWGGLERERAEQIGSRVLRLESEGDIGDLVAAASVAAKVGLA